MKLFGNINSNTKLNTHTRSFFTQHLFIKWFLTMLFSNHYICFPLYICPLYFNQLCEPLLMLYPISPNSDFLFFFLWTTDSGQVTLIQPIQDVLLHRDCTIFQSQLQMEIEINDSTGNPWSLCTDCQTIVRLKRSWLRSHHITYNSHLWFIYHFYLQSDCQIRMDII